MGRLRGMKYAYKAGRLDEYLELRFGSLAGYERYCLRREFYRTWQLQCTLLKLQVPPSVK